MLNSNKANPIGYSMVEILIVIAIIGIISIMATTSLKSVASKARDSRRISDITALRKALEIYRFSNPANSYPDNNFQVGSTISADNKYLLKFPSNPWGADGPCPHNFQYQYYQDSATSYHITYCLGSRNQGAYAGPGLCDATSKDFCE